MVPGPMTGAQLACQREAFDLPLDVHYLNCAYMSPLASSVEEAGVAGLRRKRAPHTITPQDFFDDGNAVRAAFAALIGAADRARVALMPSVSYGLAVAARNVPLDAGQSIVVVEEQFPSNVYIWRRVAADTGASLRVVPRPPERDAGALTAAVLEAIDDTTGVVAVGTVHWTDGQPIDVEAVGARAREVGAAYVVDGTQSVGALPFDVRTVQPDALIVAGYKWLLGPYGIALGYFGERLLDGLPIEEPWIVREGSDDFRGLVDYREGYRQGALRFDGGGMSNFVTVPMLRASLGLVLEWTVPAIQAYCGRLLAPLHTVAAERGWPASGGAGHIVGVTLPEGTDVVGVSQALSDAQVSVSLRGKAVRVSPHVYNDADDIDALIEALDRVIEGR